MNNNTTIETKSITWKEILKLTMSDLPMLATKINELTKECEQLVK